jgi:anaerobic selenocysteine-containing dehydrogenase
MGEEAGPDSTEGQKSICRVCFNFCSVTVQIDGGRVGRITGDRENPIYAGYRCQKGADQRAEYDAPDRLRHSLRRKDDGSFEPIPVDRPIAEIASQIAPLIEVHGPRVLALYWGSYFGYHAQNAAFSGAFMNAVGSPMVFDPITIDQPGKLTSKALHGVWMAPDQGLLQPKTALFVGTNPIVSHQGRIGPPAQLLRDFRTWGTDLIVIDPRRTEFARTAKLHLQPRPGEDPAVLAAMLKVILDEHRYDVEFVAQNVSGLESLRRAVAPFTPSDVARWAQIDADDTVRAARMFADAGRGYTCSGTGANMSAQGTLVEYLLLCLQTVCGYWCRAGDPVRNNVTLLHAAMRTAIAQAMPPFPVVDDGTPMRIRGLKKSSAGMPCAALAEEILTPGSGQVRALLSLGGSPATTLPDQHLVTRALRSLELLVHSDVQMSPTARLADYVIATKLPFEFPGTSLTADYLSLFATGWGYREPYAQYTPALVDPPAGAEVIEPWEFLYGLARELGLQLELSPGYGAFGGATGGFKVDMSVRPTSDDILAIVHAGSRIPLEEVKRHPGGALFPDPDLTVAPKQSSHRGRLQVGAEEMMSDLAAVATEPRQATLPFTLISRRVRHVMNTPGLAYPTHTARENVAFLHPHDLTALGIEDGDTVEISSGRGTITAAAASDEPLKPGIVSMTHAFGDVPGDETSPGANAARLVDNRARYDRFTGQPQMTAVPVILRPVTQAESRRRHRRPGETPAPVSPPRATPGCR